MNSEEFQQASQGGRTMTVIMSRRTSRLVILLGLAAGAFHAAPELA